MTTWVIVGCGYTGQRVARELALRRADVVVTRRDAAAAADSAKLAGPSVRGIRVDLDDPFSIDAIPPRSIVVCLAPPSRDPAAVRHLAPRAQRLVYVSSTAVYPPAHGAWVVENQPVGPTTDAGRARVAAEAALPTGAIILRAAGIYGPGRSLVDRIRDGTYRIVGDGRAAISRIHVDDLVAAILRAGESTVTGPVNVADDTPDPIGEVADAIAKHLGVPAPPRVSPGEVSAELAGMLTADRRIANGRMKEELGVVLRHPSWRGLLAAPA
jgi:nucleoside-diphosphate-sugar epimerase